jgi:hypothetical protein
VNEPMHGSGSFEALAYRDESGFAPAPRKALLRRLLEGIARWLFRLRHGRAQRAASADVGPGEGMAKLTFRLRIEPGGPMAPMIDAMIAPLMLPAAESLADQILARLEAAASERR